MRAFYPTEYRSMQRELDKTSKASNKEVVNVKKTERLTNDLNGKLGRVLGLLEKEIGELIESLDKVQVQAAEPPVNIDIDMIGNALDESGAWMVGLNDMLRRIKQRNRERAKKRRAEENKRKAEEKARKAEEEKARKAEEEKNRRSKTEEKGAPREEPAKQNKPTQPEPKAPPAEAPGDVKVDPKNAPKSGSIWESVKEFGGKIGSVGKGAYALAEGAVIKGTVITMAAMAAYDFLTQLYELKLKADAGNMTSNEFRKEVVKLIVRLVDQIGLAYAGAIIGAFAGSEVPILGNIVGFIVGLIAGAGLQYFAGDSVEAMTDYVIDKVWPADATVTPTEQTTTTTPVSSLSPISSAQAAVDPNEKPATHAQLAAQAAIPQSSPPPLQTLPDAVPGPATVASPNLEPADTGTQASIEQTQRNIENQISAHDEDSEDESADSQDHHQHDGHDHSNDATINTSTDNAADISPQESPTGGEVKVNYALAGKKRSGMPNPGIVDLVTQAAAQVGMKSITITSGKGNYISESGRKKGQKTTVHATGDAVDVVGFESPAQKLAFAKAARGLGAGGIGAYKDRSLHVDLGNVRSWNWGDPTFPQRLAEGGKVHPRDGGTLALIGEAGEPEYVVPQSKVTKFAHEMLATRPRSISKSKSHTHVVVMPIYT